MASKTITGLNVSEFPCSTHLWHESHLVHQYETKTHNCSIAYYIAYYSAKDEKTTFPTFCKKYIPQVAYHMYILNTLANYS